MTVAIELKFPNTHPKAQNSMMKFLSLIVRLIDSLNGSFIAAAA